MYMYKVVLCPLDTIIVVLCGFEVTLRDSLSGWANILPEKNTICSPSYSNSECNQHL